MSRLPSLLRITIRMQPAGSAIGVMLVLPDRHTRLHFIDDPAAGGKCRVAMASADTDPHREFAQSETADAMHAGGIDDRETGGRFGENFLALAVGQRRIRFVSEGRYWPTFVDVAHPAFEARVRASLVREQALAQWLDVESFIDNRKALHPLSLPIPVE